MSVADKDVTESQEFKDALAEAIKDETDGLKENRDAILKEKKALTKQLAGLEGIDPKKHKELLDAEEAREKEKAKAAGDWDKREAAILEKHAKETAAKDKLIEVADAAVQSHLVDAAAIAAIAAAKGSPRLLLDQVKRQVRAVKGEDGEYVVKVFDAAGNERQIVKDSKAGLMTIPDLVEELRGDAELAGAFAGSGGAGSGATKSTGTGGGAVGTVPAGDDKAFLANLDDIAAGKTKVV